MNTGNDSLVGLMARIDPAITPLDAPLDERDLAVLARVQLAGETVHNRTGLRARGTTAERAARNRWFRVPSLAIAASLVAVLGITATSVSLWPGSSTAARAETPAQLVAEPLDVTPQKLLESVSSNLLVRSVPVDTHRVRSQYWALEFRPDNPPQTIEPERSDIEFYANGTTALQIRALGRADSAGRLPPGTSGEAAGALIKQRTFAAGQYPFFFADPAGVTDWGAYLRAGQALDASATTGDYLSAVRTLLSERTLTALQQSELLRFISTLPDLRVDGTVTDRLGRAGTSLSSETRDAGNMRDVLIVTPTRGVIAHESVYTGSDRRDLTAPAVIDYTAWY
ncbi:hypothetical protein D9V32_09875 [Mycetocola tolaasinivorans]|uniref:CU044_5270 family protein n=1 Tax=Mycetocola tolaasinivorans TaxID=76635 RepID=A0A3L7A4C1_9MICO|nr:hypothetical protein [Mycetocola tolaasinivorans]RLP75203.1 hypothetical protein D9V32_09875 [Mycetocola tolaasinivorans]